MNLQFSVSDYRGAAALGAYCLAFLAHDGLYLELRSL